MRKRTTAVVSIAILVGIAATAVVLANRGGEDLFRLQQSRSLAWRSATVLSAGRVEDVVEQAPEPVPAPRRTPAAHTSCRPGGSGPLRNPWSCTIRYRSGTQAYYRVLVQPNGYYSGRGSGAINGCCVKTPSRD
jgi:hypothetical protein